MKLQKILSQHRRDFTAIYECQACGATKKGSGYDDANFYDNVIPSMACDACGERGGAAEAITPTVPPWQTI